MKAVKKKSIDPKRIDNSIDAKISISKSGDRLVIDNSGERNFIPLSIVLFEGRDVIVWEREISEAELQDSIIKEDFREFICSPLGNLNFSYRIGIKYVQNESDDWRIALISYGERKPHYEPFFLSDIIMENKCEYPEIAVVPFKTKDGKLAIRVSIPENMMAPFIECRVRKIKRHASRITVISEMSRPENSISNVYLASRRGDVMCPMEFSVSESAGDSVITASIDLDTITLVDPFWRVYIETEMYGHPVWVQPRITKTIERIIKLSPFHGKLGNGMIYYISPQRGKSFQLAIRKHEFYDSARTRFIELLALAAASVFGALFKGKGYWLVFEKFCSAAQDNGYAFFQYCMENLSKEERKHIYYVIDKHSPAYEKLKKYKSNVVDFMSFRHLFYSLIADMYVASESKVHLYGWRGKPSFVYSRIRGKEIFFLQHGVLALKRVETIFGKTGTDSMTYIVTSSKFEQDIVVNNHGYDREHVPVVGLARWDKLVDRSTDDDKTILVMPTWRKWIQDSGVEAFENSDFFIKYTNMLNNEKLLNCLRENNVRMIFYSHPKFKEYMDNIGGKIKVDEKCCRVVSFGEIPLDELIRSSHMLITDYSSVSWDFFYLGKPIIFYQFDYDLYMEQHGSYIDMTKELWGDRYLEEDELVDGMIGYIEGGFAEKSEFNDMRPKLFDYIDHDNSKRTYEFLKSIR